MTVSMSVPHSIKLFFLHDEIAKVSQYNCEGFTMKLVDERVLELHVVFVLEGILE